MRVVQIEPGPCPIFIASAPHSARYSTPAAFVTFPPIIVISGNALRISFTAVPTPSVKPWAVETAATSSPSSTSLPTCDIMLSRSSEPSGLRISAIEAPHKRRNFESRAFFWGEERSSEMRSISLKVKSPRSLSSESTTRSLCTPKCLSKNASATAMGSEPRSFWSTVKTSLRGVIARETGRAA